MRLTVKDRVTGTIIASGVQGETAHIIEGNYYFEPNAVNLAHLSISERTYNCPYKGICHWVDLTTAQTRAQNIGWVYYDPRPDYEHIKGLIGFYGRGAAGVLSECEPLANRDAIDAEMRGGTGPLDDMHGETGPLNDPSPGR